MECVVDFLCFGATDVLRKGLARLLLDGVEAAKLFEQGGDCFGADVGDGFELAGQGLAAAGVAVEGDGEAVGFVADGLEELQGGGFFT